MNPTFLLTVDTEEEWDWSGPFPQQPFSTQNIAQVPHFQKWCRDMGVTPTYFVTQSVMDVDAHVETFRELFLAGQCDLGTHLHPWCTDPVEETINEHNSHAINLPIELFRRKMRHLTQQFTACFDTHPLSYRAGRWGINGEQLAVLAQLGYSVDSSVRPFYEDRHFSYAHALTEPYWPSFRHCLQQDVAQRAIIEIPVSSGFNRRQFELCETVHELLSRPVLSRLRLIGVLWQLGIMRKITVTPEGNHWRDICACIDQCLSRGATVINMFFHSSNLKPGCTPYVRTERDKVAFLDCMARCIEHMGKKHNAQFSTVRQIHPTLTEQLTP